MSSPASSLPESELRRRIEAVPHWYHQIEIRPGVVTPGINDSAGALRHLELPERCDGLRALDIGVRDGFYSFELERRGAEVVAIDYLDPSETGFPVARELLGSSVEYRVDNVYRLSPAIHGEFDLVLFLGVIYHLRDPLLALDRIWDVCREGALLIVETQLLDNAFMRADGRFVALEEQYRATGLMQFYPGSSLRGDPTNYWAPNLECMKGMLATSGFAVHGAKVLGSRGVFHGRKVVDDHALYYRRLEKGTLAEAQGAPAPPGAPPPPAPAPAPDAVKRLQHDLAIVRNEKAALEVELDAARRRLAEVAAPPPRRSLLRRLAARARRG